MTTVLWESNIGAFNRRFSIIVDNNGKLWLNVNNEYEVKLKKKDQQEIRDIMDKSLNGFEPIKDVIL